METPFGSGGPGEASQPICGPGGALAGPRALGGATGSHGTHSQGDAGWDLAVESSIRSFRVAMVPCVGRAFPGLCMVLCL